MESQGNDVMDAGADKCGKRGKTRISTIARALVWSMLLFLLGVVHATTYVYDANGRVVAVTQGNGASAQYTYDSVGNIVQIGQVAAGQIAIFAFTPSHGSAGTSVTIYGQGFSATAASNLVKFSGTAATVSSATATQLITKVPAGASTGVISVTVAGQTATSSTPFVVDDTGAPPTIIQFSPSVVAVGSTVTVTGTHLDPPTGTTKAFVAGTPASVVSASDSQLQFLVPTGAGSGYVEVQTLYGQAQSASQILVVPSGITPTQVTSRSIASAGGAAVNISIAQGGQTAALSFQGTSGAWLSLQSSAITTTANAINYSIYGPGNQLVAQGSISASSPTIHLPRLTVSGTYIAFFTPDTAGAQLTENIESNPTLTTSAVLAVAAAAPYQSKRQVFTATQGQNLELTLNNVNAAGAQYNQFYVYVYNAAGGQVAGFYCYANNPASSCTQHLWNLAAGTYSVLATPIYGGTISFNALIKADVVGPAIATGGTAAVNLSAGQVERLTFTGTVGSTIALNVTGVTTTPTGNGVTFLVYRPDAGTITTGTPAYTSFDTASGQIVNLSNLPVSGTYTVIVAPDNGLPATATVGVVAGSTGTIPTNGTSGSYSANASGENVYLSFTATQGQNLELTLNNVNAAGAQYNQFYVYVYNAAGGQVAGFYCYANNPASSCTQHLWNLAAGTYSVLATPIYGGTISFNALIKADVVGPAIATGGTAAVNLSAGQVERLTFNAAVGDTVTLNLTGVTTTPTGNGVTFLVYRPDAGTITTNTAALTSADTINGQMVNLSGIPVSGTYTVIVAPDNGLPATATVSVVSDTAGPPVVYGNPTLPRTGAPQSQTSSGPGQSVTMTFNATQGQNLELTLSNVVATPSNNPVLVSVSTSTGNVISGTSYCYPSTSDSCRIALWNLAAGTYTVTATPYYGQNDTISFNAQIEPDVIGPALTANTPATVNLTAGEVERVTFNANVGDTVALALSNVSTTPAGQTVYVDVYRPDTGAIGNSVYTDLSTSGTTMVNLPNLPASGKYTLVIYTTSGAPASAQIAEYTSATGTPTAAIPTNNTLESYSAKTGGQNVYLTFNATQGQNLELTLSNIVATPSNNPVLVSVSTSTGNVISGTSYCYPNTADSCRVALWNLAAGTYAVTVTPYYGESDTISFSAQIEPDVIGPALTANTPATVNLTAGEVERVTFNANVGDTVALALSNVSTTPAGQTVYMDVYRPDTGALGNNAYTDLNTSGTTMVNLPNLPASGKYTLVIYTTSGAPASAQIAEYASATGTPTATVPVNNTLESYSAKTGGQNVYLAFNATQGQNLELTLSNVVAAGSNNPVLVSVSTSTGNVISGTSYCYPSTTDSCRIALWNLAAGTYAVTVTPYYGQSDTISFSAQIEPDVIGPALTANTPATLDLAAGAVERITFNAKLGDTIALALSGVTTTPTGQSVNVNVYRPDGGAITTGNYYTSLGTASTTMMNLANLPAAGMYTLVAYTTSGAPATAQIAEYASATTTPTGTLPTNNTVESYSAKTGGQNVYLTFNATQGQNLELTLGNVVAAGSNNPVLVSVSSSTGNTISSNTGCYPSTTDSCRIAMWNLAAGAYSVVVTPYYGQNDTISFSAQIEPDVIGPALTANTPTTVNLASGGVERVTFTATMGNTVALALAGVTTTPTGQSVNYNLYRPDGGQITTGNYYTSTGTASSTVLTLPNLPATGKYTMALYTNSGAPATAQLTWFAATGQPVTGAVQNFATATAGQSEFLVFTPTQGQDLKFVLTNLSITGSTGNAVQVLIDDPAGNTVANVSCLADPGVNCLIPIWKLSAGQYSVVISPPDANSKISFGASLEQNVNQQ